MVENTSNSIKETIIESRKINIGKAKIMAVMHTIRDMIHLYTRYEYTRGEDHRATKRPE